MNGTNQAAGYGTLFSTLASSRRASRGVCPQAGVGARIRALLAAIWRRHEQARVRQALERLDDHLLRDIGVTRAEVNAGLLPPFAQPEDPALGVGRPLAGRW